MLKYSIMKWQDFTNKQKIYIIAFTAIVIILLWSFFSAKLLTSGLNRKDISQNEDNQQAVVEGIILTETKDEEKYWEIYGDTGVYDSKQEVATLNGVLAGFNEHKILTGNLQCQRKDYNSF